MKYRDQLVSVSYTDAEKEKIWEWRLSQAG